MEVNAMPRSQQGTGASRRLRGQAKVPGIIYGGDVPAQNIELDHNSLYHQLKQEAFHASILSMNVEGKKDRVLLRDVQMHPWKQMILHVDFQRVSANKKIHMSVPLHFINAAIAPGVKTGGGIVSHVMNEIDITCLPDDLPEFVEVDLQNLELGHSVHIADLKLPKGVESVQQVRGDNAVVATVQVPRAIVEPEPTAAVAAEGAVAEGAAAAAGAAPAAGAAAAGGDAKKEPEKKEGGKK
ncbi:MAG TPA: 50S ribosomal protein L25/general stress protein Ctc [Burkholderiales bacterium]|nr:50S ribosomal protein L25/general stress protein Ctc [Burkholderiales bacterium]